MFIFEISGFLLNIMILCGRRTFIVVFVTGVCVCHFLQSKLFEGLEEDSGLSPDTFVPRKNIKKLVLKPKSGKEVCILITEVKHELYRIVLLFNPNRRSGQHI